MPVIVTNTAPLMLDVSRGAPLRHKQVSKLVPGGIVSGKRRAEHLLEAYGIIADGDTLTVPGDAFRHLPGDKEQERVTGEKHCPVLVAAGLSSEQIYMLRRDNTQALRTGGVIEGGRPVGYLPCMHCMVPVLDQRVTKRGHVFVPAVHRIARAGEQRATA